MFDVATVQRASTLVVASAVAALCAWGVGRHERHRATPVRSEACTRAAVHEAIDEPAAHEPVAVRAAPLPVPFEPGAVRAAPSTIPVPFELGATEFAPGDFVTIDAVEGTTDRFVVGGTYRVRGHYELASRDTARLLLSVTRTERGVEDSVPARLDIVRGVGTFDLEIAMRSAGYPHVTLYASDTGAPFSGVYFGHGDGLLRDKPWRYAAR